MKEILRSKRMVSLALALGIGGSACGGSNNSTENNSSATTENTTMISAESGTADVVIPATRYGKHTFTEVVQSKVGVSAFMNYYFATGKNPHRIPYDEKIKVNCVAYGPVAMAPTALGTWYHIVAPKEWAGEYTASNVFYNNGNASINMPNENVIDPRLKDDICPDSAPEPLRS